MRELLACWCMLGGLFMPLAALIAGAIGTWRFAIGDRVGGHGTARAARRLHGRVLLLQLNNGSLITPTFFMYLGDSIISAGSATW